MWEKDRLRKIASKDIDMASSGRNQGKEDLKGGELERWFQTGELAKWGSDVSRMPVTLIQMASYASLFVSVAKTFNGINNAVSWYQVMKAKMVSLSGRGQ